MIGGCRDRVVGTGAPQLREHRAHEPKTFAWSRSDKLLVRAGVTDGLARRIDAAGKGRIRDNSSSPYLVDQLVLADHPVAVFEQVYQQIKDLRLDRHAAVATAQLPKVRI